MLFGFASKWGADCPAQKAPNSEHRRKMPRAKQPWRVNTACRSCRYGPLHGRGRACYLTPLPVRWLTPGTSGSSAGQEEITSWQPGQGRRDGGLRPAAAMLCTTLSAQVLLPPHLHRFLRACCCHPIPNMCGQKIAAEQLPRVRCFCTYQAATQSPEHLRKHRLCDVKWYAAARPALLMLVESSVQEVMGSVPRLPIWQQSRVGSFLNFFRWLPYFSRVPEDEKWGLRHDLKKCANMKAVESSVLLPLNPRAPIRCAVPTRTVATMCSS